MVALWCLLGLIVSAICVSTLGAAFSIFGLSQLFSGATLAVALMASSLELAKFTVAAFLHQTWHRLNPFFKGYLLTAVVVLSIITSMGIFGFLSNAYQISSAALESEEVRLESLKAELEHNKQEVARVNKGVDEIPASRITKKITARADAEPILQSLAKESTRIANEITKSHLQIIEVHKKVGPLIYISRAFKMDIDTVVKYLILIFVSVFDPLAICLVIAVSDSLNSRQNSKPRFMQRPPSPQPDPNEENAESGVIRMRFAEEKNEEAI